MKDLTEVRAHIDALDIMILTLIQQRQEMVFHAAKFKNNVTEVRDDARVEAVINRLVEKAQTIGLDEILVRNVYRTMITRFIELELERHDKLTQDTPVND